MVQSHAPLILIDLAYVLSICPIARMGAPPYDPRIHYSRHKRNSRNDYPK